MTSYQDITPISPSSLITLNRYFIYFFYSIITSISFTILLPYNHITHKITFSCALIFILAIVQNNQYCAKTASFLVNLIILQIVLMAIVFKFSQIFGRSKLFYKKLPQFNINQHRYIFSIIILTLFITNIIAFIYCLTQGYHTQLHPPKKLLIMLLTVAFGFILLTLVDKIYIKYSKDSIKTSTRRKIFHFIPILLLPFFNWYEYRLFILMAFGAGYLFWMLEIGRYFGMLAKVEFVNNNSISKSNRKYNNNNQSISAFINQINIPINILTLQSNYHQQRITKVVQLINFSNLKISQFSLIKWMEQLNSTREQYFWFTHLSLIFGLVLTYTYYSIKRYTYLNYIQLEIKQNVSVVLVIADAMAAIIGKKYGKNIHIIPWTNQKTLQGFVGFVLTLVIIQLGLYFSFSLFYQTTFDNFDLKFVLISGIVCGIGELYSGDMDNIVIGMVYVIIDYLYTTLFHQPYSQ